MSGSECLKGRSALVTGANKGLGAAIVTDLAKNGANVVLAVRNPSSADAVLSQLQEHAKSLHVVQCDVADKGASARVVAVGIERFGALDILINNAGQVEPIGHFLDNDAEAWERAIVVNLFGVQRMTRAALPHFIERGAGTIVNISSGAGHRPREGWSAVITGGAAYQ